MQLTYHEHDYIKKWRKEIHVYEKERGNKSMFTEKNKKTKNKKKKKNLREWILQEGIALKVRENESLWALKYGCLTEKKILKESFQNFFNVNKEEGCKILGFFPLFIEVYLLKK